MIETPLEKDVGPVGRQPDGRNAYSRVPPVATEDVFACPLCGQSRYARYASGYDYELLTCGNEWQFVQCEGCTHVWLTPRPAVSALSTIYPPHYYAYNFTTRVHPVAVAAKTWLDDRKLRSIFRSSGARPASYLDVGCGSGRMLRSAKRYGIPSAGIHGLELDDAVVASLRAEGYDVWSERVEQCDKIPEASLDVCTMFHVIEHVDDPAAVLRKLASWVRPGGVLAVETPNIDSLDRRLFADGYWGGYHIPRHWNLYTAGTLERHLRETGFEPFATIYQTGHAFWMYSFHHWLLYEGKPWPRLARLFDPFQGLPLLATFTLFDKVRAALGMKTSAVLVLARRTDG